MDIEELNITDEQLFKGFLAANTMYHAAFNGAPITFMADFVEQAVKSGICLKAVLIPVLSDMGHLIKNPDYAESMKKQCSTIVREVAMNGGLSPDDFPQFYNGV
jgi:hypothetical protein